VRGIPDRRYMPGVVLAEQAAQPHRVADVSPAMVLDSQRDASAVQVGNQGIKLALQAGLAFLVGLLPPDADTDTDDRDSRLRAGGYRLRVGRPGDAGDLEAVIGEQPGGAGQFLRHVLRV